MNIKNVVSTTKKGRIFTAILIVSMLLVVAGMTGYAFFGTELSFVWFKISVCLFVGAAGGWILDLICSSDDEQITKTNDVY